MRYHKHQTKTIILPTSLTCHARPSSFCAVFHAVNAMQLIQPLVRSSFRASILECRSTSATTSFILKVSGLKLISLPSSVTLVSHVPLSIPWAEHTECEVKAASLRALPR